ncbi:MAG: hypothetical protein U0531_18090 [Dehalococcoidia bacterium]
MRRTWPSRFSFVAPAELYERAFRFARSYDLPSMDSLAVVLAHILGAELWTADRRLLSAIWLRRSLGALHPRLSLT